MSRITDIIGIIRCHRGAENPISSTEIGRRLRIPGRCVKREIEEAYSDGTLEELEMPVCACARGYFIATDYEEWQRYYDVQCLSLAKLTRRIKSILALAAAHGICLQKSKP